MVVAAIWAVACLILWERVSPHVKRLLDIYEQQGKPGSVPKREPLPADLASAAAQWGEPWARDQAMAAMRESYDGTGNWDAVRTIHGIGNS